MALNNSRARAKLVMTGIVRLLTNSLIVFYLMIICRKSILDKNKTTTVYEDSNSTEEEVDLVLWLWNAFVSWAFEEPTDDEIKTIDNGSQTEKDMGPEIGADDKNHDVDGTGYWNVIVSEEEHLELFYFVSTVLLIFLGIIIIKKHNKVSTFGSYSI